MNLQRHCVEMYVARRVSFGVLALTCLGLCSQIQSARKDDDDDDDNNNNNNNNNICKICKTA